MRVERGEGQPVHRLEMHGHKKLAGLDGGSEHGRGASLSASGDDGYDSGFADAKAGGVGGVDFHDQGARSEFAEDVAFVGARACVPLGGGAPAGVEEKGVVGAGWLSHRAGGVEQDYRALIGSKKLSVGEKPAFLCRFFRAE